MMQRWELPAFGRDNLVLTSALRPKPDPKEVLVKVEAVSLNYRDLLILENGLGGGYDLPLLPGSDFAGTVIEVGVEVTRFRPDDRVINTDIIGWIDGPAPTLDTNTKTIMGRLAQYVVVNPEHLVAAPASLSPVEASTLPCAGLTAWRDYC
jgi:NADPH:quinone reductase-like Zn-dependent oxidoreductase